MPERRRDDDDRGIDQLENGRAAAHQTDKGNDTAHNVKHRQEHNLKLAPTQQVREAQPTPFGVFGRGRAAMMAVIHRVWTRTASMGVVQ